MEVAVTSLCEFAARSGSLEFRYTPAPSASEGIAGHMTVQQRRPDPYVAEYLLKGQCEGLTISGRVDGYYANPAAPYLEEIKTHRGNLNRIGPGRRALHWAQLKVYGALICQRDGLDGIELRLTYFEVRDDTENIDDAYHSAEDLALFLQTLSQRYVVWARQEQKHREHRDQALGQLIFPFGSFRKGQRDLSASVYRAANQGKTLLLQAPTGIGKTMGVLFPALKAMPAAALDRVFFLTNRNTGKHLGLEAMRSVAAQLADSAEHCEQTPDDDSDQSGTAILRVLELNAKEASCDHPDKACHGDSCPLAHGFFDRLPAARAEAVAAAVLDSEGLASIARDHALCRYFLAQEMARWSDVVIADVNHYYDQFALLFALSAQNNWRVMPLVDEAHNLIDRARGMYSMSIAESDMLYTIRNVPKPLLKPLSDLESAWTQLIEPFCNGAGFTADGECKHYLDKVPEELNSALYSLIAAITDYLTDHPADGEVQQVLFTALGFLRLAESFADHSLCTLRYQTGAAQQSHLTGSASLTIDNLIPADHLRTRFASSTCTVLFSATLTPGHYHRDLLGLPEDCGFVDIDSPFTRSQIDLRLVTGINTRQYQRHYSIAPICQRIAQQMAAAPGNYLVYTSSFEYLNTLYAHMQDHHPSLRLLRQRSGMSSFERHEFMVSVSDSRPSVGFAVLGGIFGEGIDLPGEQLIGVFVATLGLPPHDDMHEVLRARLDQRYGQGYDYTYLYPGLQKVVQAAGRLIRTPEDKGVIELIDDRFSRPEVKALLPAWWQL